MMKRILSVLIGASLACCAMQASAEEPTLQNVQLDIAQQSLNAALLAWADQTGFQLICLAPEVARALTAPKVKGTFTATAALQQLLEGTPLVYEFTSERTVTVRTRLTQASITGAVDRQEVPRLQLAALGAGEQASGQAAERGAFEATRERNARRGAAPADERDVEEVEEVVVTGTHIRRTQPVGASPLVIDRADIDRTGFSTIQDLMQNVPQNFAEVSPAGRFAVEGGSDLGTANNDRISSINLRGLGAQSTLTLIDGLRSAGGVGGRVVDISMIPLSMIDRIEVVTGGHSAIYGSDAVAGVANLVTRREFKGAQTQVYYGGTSDGGDRMQVSQLAGMSFDKGGFAAGYDYSRDWAFDLADAGLLSSDFSVSGVRQTHLQPQADTRRHSGFVSGHYRPSEQVELRGNALYTDKRYDEEDRQLWSGATTESINRTRHPGSFYGVSGGASIDLPQAWQLNVSATTSTNDVEQDASIFADFGGGISVSQTGIRKERAMVSSLSTTADGDLFHVAAGAVRGAIGAEARREGFRASQTVDGALLSSSDDDRTVRSAFAEFIVPLVNNDAAKLLRRVELSVAGRYDDYSDFGNTFNPQFGILWQTAGGISFRGGYSKAFRAPALVELTDSNSAFLVTVEDPQAVGGTSDLIILGGNNPDVGPERAKGWNLGMEFRPLSLPDTLLSISYFNVEYTDRLEVAEGGFIDQLSALTREERYPQLINRNPEAGSLQTVFDGLSSFFNNTSVPFGTCLPFAPCTPSAADLLAADPGVVLFDNRTHNVAIDEASGMDAQLRTSMATPVGEIAIGLNATYTLNHTRSHTTSSPQISLLNEVGKPVDLRLRGNLGWTRGAYGVYGYLNYVDGYSNPFSTPALKIDSWTTMDLTLQLDGSKLETGDFFKGIVATLSIENLFDRDPPIYKNSAFNVLYDTTNASPFGRFVSMRLAKQW